MKFIIIKEESYYFRSKKIRYWVKPRNIILSFLISVVPDVFFSSNWINAYACFDTLEEAKNHIKKWNNGDFICKKEIIKEEKE